MKRIGIAIAALCLIAVATTMLIGQDAQYNTKVYRARAAN